jgi:hypothetical protein
MSKCRGDPAGDLIEPLHSFGHVVISWYAHDTGPRNVMHRLTPRVSCAWKCHTCIIGPWPLHTHTCLGGAVPSHRLRGLCSSSPLLMCCCLSSRMIYDILKGLNHLHEKGIVHR